MVGRLGTIAARQGLSIGLREAARKLCAAVASKPDAYAVKDIEYGISKLQTASSLAEILLDDPAECQRLVASLALSIAEAIRSLETSLSVRQAAKPPVPDPNPTPKVDPDRKLPGCLVCGRSIDEHDEALLKAHFDRGFRRS